MNTLKRFFLTSLILTSSISLPLNIASQLSHAQKTEQQVKIEDRIAEKKADLKFNASVSILGVVLFLAGTVTEISSENKLGLLAYGLGVVFSGAGTYFGAHDAHKILQLKNKLNACNADQKS